MTIKETEQLIQRYLDGETSPEEERQLAIEVSRKGTPKEWQMIREMLGELTVDEVLFNQIMAERKPAETDKSKLRRLWPWLAAACVAVFLVVVLAPPRTENQPLAQQNVKVQQPKTEEALQLKPADVHPMSADEPVKRVLATVKEPSVRQKPKATPAPQQDDEVQSDHCSEEPVNMDEMMADFRERQQRQTYDYTQVEQEIRQKGEAFSCAINNKMH